MCGAELRAREIDTKKITTIQCDKCDRAVSRKCWENTRGKVTFEIKAEKKGRKKYD